MSPRKRNSRAAAAARTPVRSYSKYTESPDVAQAHLITAAVLEDEAVFAQFQDREYRLRPATPEEAAIVGSGKRLPSDTFLWAVAQRRRDDGTCIRVFVEGNFDTAAIADEELARYVFRVSLEGSGVRL